VVIQVEGRISRKEGRTSRKEGRTSRKEGGKEGSPVAIRKKYLGVPVLFNTWPSV
jgi:hypothetical protein